MEANVFKPESYQQLLQRLDKIEADTKPLWGKMSAAQMFAHCAAIQSGMNGNKVPKTTINKIPGGNLLVKLFKPMIRKQVVGGNYKRNAATYPAFVQKTEKDFEQEKANFLNMLDAFVSAGEESANNTLHDFFGKMTAEEKGGAIYKHLDHHLKQFGV